MNQFLLEQEAMTMAYGLSVEDERRSYNENWSYPFGLRKFSPTASLRLGAAASTANLLIASSRSQKLPATRREGYSEMESGSFS
jgi:hypothetical protein